MLLEQRDIYYDLAEKALEWAAEVGIKLDDIVEGDWLELASTRVGSYYYAIELSIRWGKDEKTCDLLLRGGIDYETGFLVLVEASLREVTKLDLNSLIEEFKDRADLAYRCR